MVAYLGLCTHELLYEEIGNIKVEILSSQEKAECSQRIFTLVIIIFGFVLHLLHNK